MRTSPKVHDVYDFGFQSSGLEFTAGGLVLVDDIGGEPPSRRRIHVKARRLKAMRLSQ